MKIILIAIVVFLQFNINAKSRNDKNYDFKKGDRSLQFLDFGVCTNGLHYNNLNQQIAKYNFPKVYNGYSILSSNLYFNTHNFINTTFGFGSSNDTNKSLSTNNITKMINLRYGYNLFKNNKIDRFSIIPCIGLSIQRNKIVLKNLDTKIQNLIVDNYVFDSIENNKKIVQKHYISTTSILINYGTRTGSLLDIFSFGLEPNFNYVIPLNNTTVFKNSKLFTDTEEKLFSFSLNIHLRIILVSYNSKRMKMFVD